MREWRKTHRPTPEQAWKVGVREHSKLYVRHGYIQRRPCQNCGSGGSQMHHPDYDESLLVQWLCRPCHLRLHQMEHAA